VETDVRKRVGAEILMKRFFLLSTVLTLIVLPQNQTVRVNRSIEWNIDNLSSIGGFPVTVFGNPVVQNFPDGKAVLFDGVDDGLIVKGCPLNGSTNFTVEIIIRPDSASPENGEERFLHIQHPSKENRRILLELRMNKRLEWVVDTHVRSDSSFLTMLSKPFPHAVSRWYHVALVYRDGIASHFVNGKKEMSGPVIYLPIDSAFVSIGMRMNQRSFTRGAVRSVRMTNDALEPGQFKNPFAADTNALIHGSMELQYADDFDTPNGEWISEFETPAGSSMSFIQSTLDVSSTAGATMWYKHRLEGNIVIMYDATVIMNGGPNDRVSDLNAFWMANDPNSANLFTRNGKFSEYDDLALYYSGIGGHDNTTTRFRKYFSDGTKPVIKEYLDKEHLLTGNTRYKIMIVVEDGRIVQMVNDEIFFDYRDPSPYTGGFFAFRTTRSHQAMDNFKVFRIVRSK
jgi:hypothetical protein